MQIARITCPGCGIQLEVKNPTNAAVKDVKCPRCQKRIQLRFRKSEVAEAALAGPATELGGQAGSTPKPGAAETQLGNPTNPGTGATELGGQGKEPITTGPSPAVQQANPRLVCHGREYTLQIGMNTVGRRSQKKPATVMLDVEDMYMSRQHIAINVTRLPNGSLRATVRNYQNTNATQVAGLPLAQGDEVVLYNGTTIKMGDTEIVYRQ